MSTIQRTTAWIMVLFCMVPVLAFAQARGKLIGKVVDTDGKPLQGVVVTITSPQLPNFRDVQTTDKRGTFTVEFREINVTYVYRFEKPGHQTFQAQQLWQLEGTDHNQWTMPLASTTVGLATPASGSKSAIDAYNAGVAALKAKDPATAEARFKEAVQQDPNLVPGWAALSSVQVQNGRNTEAAESAERAIALGSTDEAVLMSRYQAYRNLKDDAKSAEALKDLEKVGRRAEEAKRVHNEAVALVRAGDNAGAFAKFQEALNIDPNLQPALMGLATAGLKIGKNAEAAAAAETVLKTDPTNAQAIRLRYNACLALGDKDKLYQALVSLAVVDPQVATKGMLALAFDAYDANDRAKAKERFTKVLDLDPNQALAHYYLGLVYVNEGATGDAKSHLERFLALAPNSTEAATARDILKQLK